MKVGEKCIASLGYFVFKRLEPLLSQFRSLIFHHANANGLYLFLSLQSFMKLLTCLEGNPQVLVCTHQIQQCGHAHRARERYAQLGGISLLLAFQSPKHTQLRGP